MYALFAWRYFKSKKSVQAIQIIAWISVVAVSVGAAALIVVLSVFNGFEGLIKGLYNDFYPDIQITAAKGKTFVLSPDSLQQIKQIPAVLTISAVLEEKALLVNDALQATVTLQGVDTNFSKINRITRHLIGGTYDLGTAEQPNLVMGAGVENALGIFIGQNNYPLVAYLPDKTSHASSSLDNLLVSATVQPMGSFMVQPEFDNKYAFTNFAFMQAILETKPNEYAAFYIQCKDSSNSALQKTGESIQKLIGNQFKVLTKYQQNQGLYRVMQTEKWIVYALLSLILIIAAFNITSALTMLVLEKQKDIGILKALGADNLMIIKIFLSEGLLICSIGGLIGMLLGAIICWVQLKFKLIKLHGVSFIINYYPVRMELGDFLLVGCTILLIAILAAFVPAYKASKEIFSLKT